MWPKEKKYDPLYQHLLFSGSRRKTMSFTEIEAVIEAALPSSARKRPEWWSNSARGHSQAEAWRNAGYKTSGIDLVAETVEFTLEGWNDGYTAVKLPQAGDSDVSAGFAESGQGDYQATTPHPLFGIWAGKVTLLPDIDYTRPAFDLDSAS
jgi:hypothetical protein